MKKSFFRNKKISYSSFLTFLRDDLVENQKYYSWHKKSSDESVLVPIFSETDPIVQKKIIEASRIIVLKTSSYTLMGDATPFRPQMIIEAGNLLVNYKDCVADISAESIALLASAFFHYSTLPRHTNCLKALSNDELLTAIRTSTDDQEQRISCYCMVEALHYRMRVNGDNKEEVDNFRSEALKLIGSLNEDKLKEMSNTDEKLLKEGISY